MYQEQINGCCAVNLVYDFGDHEDTEHECSMDTVKKKVEENIKTSRVYGKALIIAFTTDKQAKAIAMLESLGFISSDLYYQRPLVDLDGDDTGHEDSPLIRLWTLPLGATIKP